LSTIPAFATTLFGVFAGLLLGAAYDPIEKVARLFVFGSLLVGGGAIFGWFFPINKPIWTSSYAVFTAGLAFCCLAMCMWFFDIRDNPRTAKFFTIYGVNAIALYVGSGVLARTLAYVKVDGLPLQQIVHGRLFASWMPPHVASLCYAITWILGWFLVLAWMYRRRIFIKI
jgi:predicted acyltransferase